MNFFKRIIWLCVLATGLVSATIAAAQPRSIEGRLTLLESEFHAMSLEISYLRCLQSGRTAAECAQEAFQLGESSSDVIALAATIPTTIDGNEIASIPQARAAIVACANAASDFGQADHINRAASQLAEELFSQQCSEDDLRAQIASAAEDIRDAVHTCLGAGEEVADAFARWEAAADSSSLPDVLRLAAAEANELRPGAEQCVEDAQMAAESLNNSADALMNAIAATAAFCAAVPEPYSCAIFGGLQLLMALFSSGDGGGGDGNGDPGPGPESGTGSGPVTVTEPNPGDAGSAAVAEGTGCTNPEITETRFTCSGGFEFRYAAGLAEINTTTFGDAGPELSAEFASILADNNGSFLAMFGDGRMVARGTNELQFCVNRIPGLPNQAFPEQARELGFAVDDPRVRVWVVIAPVSGTGRTHTISIETPSQEDLASPACAP